VTSLKKMLRPSGIFQNLQENFVSLFQNAIRAYNVSSPVGQKLREKGVGRTRGF
jgi:hypothetical protein